MMKGRVNRWLKIEPPPGGISGYRLDFKAVVGDPTINLRFQTFELEIQPRSLVDLGVEVPYY